MGKKQKVSHAVIVQFTKDHPEMKQSEIGQHFGLSACRISAILRSHGETRYKRGRQVKRKPNESELQHQWEKILHAAGLGMDRGLRIDNKRILYGPNPLGDLSFEDPTF